MRDRRHIYSLVIPTQLDRLFSNDNQEHGQIRFLSFFLISMMLLATFVIAGSNLTNNQTNGTGYIITNSTIDDEISNNQTLENNELQNESDNTTNTTEETENQTIIQTDQNDNDTESDTINTNITNTTNESYDINNTESDANQTTENNTSITNTTKNETNSENTTNEDGQSVSTDKSIIEIELIANNKIIRKNIQNATVILENTGNVEAKNIKLDWVLPEKTQVISNTFDCDTIDPNSQCESSIQYKIPIDQKLGPNEISVSVIYE